VSQPLASPSYTFATTLVDTNGEADRLRLHSTRLGEQLEKWGLNDVGFAYNIVAVFGSQSTGKS